MCPPDCSERVHLYLGLGASGGSYLKDVFYLFSFLGFLKTDDGGEIVLSDNGAYWLHVLQDLYSIEYISQLWGTSKEEPWPQKVVL